MSWVGAAKEWLPKWQTVLLVLCYMGLQKGVFKDGKLPLDGAVASAAAAPLVGENEDQGLEEGVGIDDAKLKSLRQKCDNTMWVVCQILGDAWHHRLIKMLVTMSEAVAVQHNKELAGLKGPLAVLEWHLWFSQGGYTAVLSRIWEALCSIEKLKQMGFELVLDETDYSVGSSASSSSAGDKVPKAHLTGKLRTENVFAEHTFKYALSLFKYRCLTHIQYTHGFPNLFVLLLSTQPEVVNEGLDKCRAAFETMMALEERAKACPHAGRMLKGMMFPTWVAPRELLITLAQFNFSWIPPASVRCSRATSARSASRRWWRTRATNATTC
jgi:hypothetical protein